EVIEDWLAKLRQSSQRVETERDQPDDADRGEGYDDKNNGIQCGTVDILRLAHIFELLLGLKELFIELVDLSAVFLLGFGFEVGDLFFQFLQNSGFGEIRRCGRGIGRSAGGRGHGERLTKGLTDQGGANNPQ